MKIVVIDDDPTGSQSVYGCPLLLSWDQDILTKGIRSPSSLLFVLANTRSMSPQMAETTTRDICQSIQKSINNTDLNFDDVLFISRGDSTLRGHGVLEPTILSQELGPFDATFHVPAFFEGGRTTVNGVHFLNGSPVHLSNFASDQIFGYSTSYLPDWLEEKSKGEILSQSVFRVTIEQLQDAIKSDKGMKELCVFLKALSRNVSVVVDAEDSSHLEVFAKAVIQLMGEKRFLFRSAASLISAFAQLPKNSYIPSSLASLRLKDQCSIYKPGLIVVGSHVQLADQQLAVLLKNKNCEGVELPVYKISRVLDGSLPDVLLKDLENRWFMQLKKILQAYKTPVLYTSRGEVSFPSVAKRMFFGLQLAELMARLTTHLCYDLGYVIIKGGITTQILLQKGLGLGIVELKGQLLPGLSVICPYSNENIGQLPILTFPGNLGDSRTLLNAWQLMEQV